MWMRAFGLAGLLTTLWVSFASAQSRRAAIRVNVTVLDAAASDVLGAHALAPAPVDARLAASPHGDAWRITAGASPELSLRAERLEPGHGLGPAPQVAICESVDDTVSRCRDQRLPALPVNGAYRGSDLVVRFRQDGGAPVRLTLAYTGT
jgi:hypothetical protein